MINNKIKEAKATQGGQEQETLSYCATAAGILEVHTQGDSLFRAVFVDSLPKGAVLSAMPLCNLHLQGTEFQVAVWQAALAIPEGTCITYEQLAVMVGKPKAYRAVANALGANPVAYFVPCHRIVRKNGHLGGYRWGLDKKKLLLEAEKRRNYAE